MEKMFDWINKISNEIWTNQKIPIEVTLVK